MNETSISTNEPDTPELPGLDPHNTARDELRRIMSAEAMPAAAIARQTTVAYPTFSAWLNGNYSGRNEPILEKVRAWLDSRKTAARTRAALPRAPEFLETPTSEAMMSTFEHAQHAPDMVVVSGPPGIGKTVSAQAYRKRANAVFMITAEPCWSSSPRILMETLLEEIGCTERFTRQKTSSAIVKRLQNTGGLVLVDEAQHLSTKAMDQLRTIHDLSGVGVAMVGNETVYSRMEGRSREVEFAQLFSRVGKRTKRAGVLKGDIEMLLDAWHVDGNEQRALLRAIARKPGALRGMTKTLRLASMLAGVDRREVVSTADITAAWQQISNSEITRDAA